MKILGMQAFPAAERLREDGYNSGASVRDHTARCFPAGTQVSLKAGASADSATPDTVMRDCYPESGWSNHGNGITTIPSRVPAAHARGVAPRARAARLRSLV